MRNFVVDMHNENAFSNTLIHWYLANCRDLPWRHTRDPYLIWVSEIILQQTQVAQGLDYYHRFIAQFPDVQTLAAAPLDQILKAWQGLGYYSRARHLHASAQQIVQKFGGIFPKNHADVLSLVGVGRYTAAAICSFAYNQPYAAVDGNGYRVLARYFGLDTPIDTAAGQRQFFQLADEVLSPTQPALHNQALMEFGALHCTPTAPRCDDCPLAASCAALATNSVSTLPRKQGKTQVRNRYFNYIFPVSDGKTLLHQRTAGDIWQGLYEFPLVEAAEDLAIEKIFSSDYFQKIIGNQPFTFTQTTPVRKHILTHQRIFTRCLAVEIPKIDATNTDFIIVPTANLADYPMSRLMEKLLTDLSEK